VSNICVVDSRSAPYVVFALLQTWMLHVYLRCWICRVVTTAIDCLEHLECSDTDENYLSELERLEGNQYLCSEDARRGKHYNSLSVTCLVMCP